MNGPAHTPYDGSSKPFTIGLKPLGLDQWIDVDEYLLPHLAEKRRLYADIPEKVFVEENGTREAQQEVLDLIVAYLAANHPRTHRDAGSGVEVVGAGSGGGPCAAPRAAARGRAALRVQDAL